MLWTFLFTPTTSTVSSMGYCPSISAPWSSCPVLKPVPTLIDDKLSYIPWGGDNQMPFDILDLIEKYETLATCQCFNAEVCYGAGLRYDTSLSSTTTKQEVEDFYLDNDVAVSQDLKHFSIAQDTIKQSELKVGNYAERRIEAAQRFDTWRRNSARRGIRSSTT